MMNSISSVCRKETGTNKELAEMHRAWFPESGRPVLES